MVRTLSLILLSFYYSIIYIYLLGVGPVIDCEIDDECDEPDYLSKKKLY